jgi:hypothetical protein
MRATLEGLLQQKAAAIQPEFNFPEFNFKDTDGTSRPDMPLSSTGVTDSATVVCGCNNCQFYPTSNSGSMGIWNAVAIALVSPAIPMIATSSACCSSLSPLARAAAV